MALPTFQAFKTPADISSVNPTTWTPTFPTGVWLANDIIVIAFETDVALSNPSMAGGSETWSEFPFSRVGSANGTYLNAWWARASQNDPTAPTISVAAPNHIVGSSCAIRGCHTSGNPWDVYSSGSNDATNATIPGAQTTVDDCLILILCSSGFNGSNTNRFTAWTNSDLGSLTERFDEVNTIGNGGGFGAATGTKVTAGTYGSTTVTEGFAGHGYATIAFKPPQAQNASVTAGPIVVSAAVNAPSASGAASTTPAAVPGTAQVNTPTASAGASVTPAAVVGTAFVPTPTVTAVENASITPDAVPAIATVQAPAVVGNANAPPEAVAATATVPTPVVSTAGDASVTPAAVVGTAFVPQPTVAAGTDAAVTFLDAPTGLVAHALSATSVRLTWNAVSGAGTYRVFRNGVFRGSTASLLYDDDVSANAHYDYAVVAKP